MASFNKIMIVGYLGRDPEIRYTPQGKAFCSFSIATTEKRKDNTGESQDVTTWFRVTYWDRMAEVANQYLSKGKQVYVEGRLRTSEYTDREGQKRQTLEVFGTDLQFLSPRGDDAGTGGGSSIQSSSARPSAQQQPDEADGPMTSDSDIPF
ncbi:MAG: single-stranded DNA-binding protein [Blastocatellia bacterium]